MTLLSTLFASAVVPPAAVALVLLAVLFSVGLGHWQQARPRFAPIFVRPQQQRRNRDRHDDLR